MELRLLVKGHSRDLQSIPDNAANRYSIKERWLNCKLSVLFWKKYTSGTKVFPWTSYTSLNHHCLLMKPLRSLSACTNFKYQIKKRCFFFTCSVKSTVHTWISHNFNMSGVIVLAPPQGNANTLGKICIIITEARPHAAVILYSSLVLFTFSRAGPKLSQHLLTDPLDSHATPEVI